MRLRTFLCLACASTVALMSALFSRQVERTLERGFDELRNTQLQNVSEITRSVLASRQAHLLNFARLVQSNHDLASSFLLAWESKDLTEVREKVLAIKARGGFDLVDVLSAKGALEGLSGLQWNGYGLKLEDLSNASVRVISIEGEPHLLCFAPLDLYDETVGVLVLGYAMNRHLGAELEAMTHGRIRFYIEGTVQPETQPLPEELVRQIPFTEPGLEALRAEVQTASEFGDALRAKLRRNMGLAGLVLLISFLLLFYFIFEIGFVRRFQTFLVRVHEAAGDLREGRPHKTEVHRYWVKEVDLLARAFEQFSASFLAYDEKIKDQLEETAKAKQRAALSEVARQVAHDIRSPLAALQSINEDLPELAEGKRIVLRSAITRIQDIANLLLRGSEETDGLSGESRGAEAAAEPVSPQLVSTLLEEVASEKRTQYRAHLGVSIEAKLDAESYGLFSRLQVREFRRVLSNLIDNAIDAIGTDGAVTLTLGRGSYGIELAVVDNGVGIPEDILPLLTEKGATFGKTAGHGLGLFHAKSVIERWGGALKITSSPGKGTRVALGLPVDSAPAWFAPRVAVGRDSCVVVLDDDVSIHHIWQKRFDSIFKADQRVKVRHFSSPTELSEWIAKGQYDRDHLVCLVDYELIGREENGLDVIESLGLFSCSFLVTSRYAEEGVLERASRLGVRILPKSMAGFVPLAVGAESEVQEHTVLIDDDPLMRLSWTTAARARGATVSVFATPEEFFRYSGRFYKTSPIYVDVQLAGGVDGIEVSRKVSEAGFSRVFLATGHPPESFAPMAWVQRVVGKEPPWPKRS